MSTSDNNSDAIDRECPLIDGRREIQRVEARRSSVGGIPVSRSLPSRHRRLIGAWCFLDHAGPATFAPGDTGLRVGPHPHTALQTFTWMIAGNLLHRDSLGHEQVIRPGQVNLMTAGRGITHTEESLTDETDLHATQLWIALPHEHRNIEPRFDHYPKLPRFSIGGLDATLLVGRHGEQEAPTLSYSPLLGMDLCWDSNSEQVLALREDFEYGILPLEGAVHIDGEHFDTDELAYLGINRREVSLRTEGSGRALLIGGEPLQQKITIWWNFVGYSREDVAAAQDDWEAAADRFGAVPGTDMERMTAPPIPWKR
jgi:quercetin 2,3-dioxygenase